MTKNFLNEIEKQLLTESKYVSSYTIKNLFIALLILKYYCDNGTYSYQEIIESKEIKLIPFPLDDLKFEIGPIKHTKLLALIQYENLQDMIKEYLSNENIGSHILNNNEKKLCASTKLNKEVYDMNGNTIYIIDKFENTKHEIALFKFYDKVLGINNQYLKYDEISKTEYNYLYVYDNNPRYLFIKNTETDVYEFIRKSMYDNKELKVLLHTEFKKVSNMKDAKFLIKKLSKIILYDDKNTFIYFENKDNYQISIINYNTDKIKSLEQLQQIINNDRKQKDVLVKTTVKDIANNHYRIGFKLYQNNSINTTRNINEIVDENTELIEKLSRINKDIEEEINILMNR